MKVIIIAKHPAWGASDNFYRAFKSQNIDSTLLCLKYDKYKRTDEENIVTILNKDNFKYWSDTLINDDVIVLICSPVAIKSLMKKFGNIETTNLINKIKKKVIFITGTEYLKYYKNWNKWFQKNNIIHKFCEIEMVKLGKNNIYLPHPMDYSHIDCTKNKKITISHAPGLKERVQKKGTDIILRVIDRLKQKFDFEYDHIVGVSFNECIIRKAKSHIFIDQINPNVGGIGKNGYEGLALNCITMASVNNFEILKEHERPPVINVNNENELELAIINLLTSKVKMKNYLDLIKNWNQNNNYKTTVNKILGVFK